MLERYLLTSHVLTIYLPIHKKPTEYCIIIHNYKNDDKSPDAIAFYYNLSREINYPALKRILAICDKVSTLSIILLAVLG